MSRRTAEASKAVRLAWEREQQLVLVGEGTRDWSVEQQKSIIDKGKAYDENGKPFEGHHMKNVAQNPEYQGDPDNIQLLSRKEHKAAHGGDFHNPTNGYYDYKTGLTKDFGTDKYTPCEVIKLSEPLNSINAENDKSSDFTENDVSDIKNEIDNSKQLDYKERESYESDNNPHNKMVSDTEVQNKKNIMDVIKNTASAVVDFGKKHPGLVNGIKKGLEIVAAGAATAGVIYKAVKEVNSSGNSKNGGSDYDNIGIDDIGDDSYDYDSSEDVDYPDERSSPREHDVSGYDRMQNGKIVHVNPYKRGRKKDNDE